MEPETFSKDVMYELQEEGEDGSTPLTRLLDKMCFAALEHGSEGCFYQEDKQ